jgi:hypothetical protein
VEFLLGTYLGAEVLGQSWANRSNYIIAAASCYIPDNNLLYILTMLQIFVFKTVDILVGVKLYLLWFWLVILLIAKDVMHMHINHLHFFFK